MNDVETLLVVWQGKDFHVYAAPSAESAKLAGDNLTKSAADSGEPTVIFEVVNIEPLPV